MIRALLALLERWSGGTGATWGGMRVRLLGGTSDGCGVLGGRGDGISAGEGLDPGEAGCLGRPRRPGENGQYRAGVEGGREPEPRC